MSGEKVVVQDTAVSSSSAEIHGHDGSSGSNDPFFTIALDILSLMRVFDK